MPLQISDSDSIIGQATAPDSEAQYLFFLASGTPPWCPDCRDALPAIEKVFGKDAPVLHVILVGTRDEWKTPANRWRGSPLYVDQTPTILKLVHVSKRW